MKRYFKCLSAVLFTIMMMLQSILPTSAEVLNNDENLTVLYAEDVAPCFDITCMASPIGKHNMKSNGIGKAYNSSGNLEIDGYCYQCSYCYLVLISERDPCYQYSLGKYATTMAYEPIGTYGCVLYNAAINAFYGDRRQDSYWQGFQFSKGL